MRGEEEMGGMDQNWLPYCGAAPVPGDWLSRWNGDPALIMALAVLGLWAARRDGTQPIFYAGFALLILLFLSPLCALSSALFSVRVAHHILLTAVAAPLMILGMPRLVVGGSAALWTAAHIFLFWVWHAPGPYALALSHDAIFWVMQLSLIGSAMAFWIALRQASDPLAIGLLLLMMVQMGLLGALLTFAGAPLYVPHYTTTLAWSLTPLEDQQLGGLIMWAPASGLYLAAALWRGWKLFSPRLAAA